MKKIKNYQQIILVVLILFLAVFVRFYNFTNRINFGPEQAISLITSADYIRHKPTLLGNPSTQRVTSKGHILFSGAFFTYSLVPLLLIFNYDPIFITAFFALINIVTGFIIYLIVKKIAGIKAALFSAILFLFNDYMIAHSLFIWIVNYTPFLNVIIFYLLWAIYHKTDRGYYPFIIGLLTGISFGLEYLYLFTATLIFTFLILVSKKKLETLIFFISGNIVGNIPMVLFDLKHGYYHMFTLYQYFIDTLVNPGNSKISYYHFLQFWPLAAIFFGVVITKIYQKQRVISFGILVLYVLFNLTSSKVSFFSALGMSGGLNYPKILSAASAIATDNPKSFNVATLLDFDSRAYPLRYLLEYKFGYKPMGVEEYPNANILYALADKNYNFSDSKTWEIVSFMSSKVEQFKIIDNRYSVFKLTRF